jgi:Fic family protein
MIHPFSDGNGRMARCLQALVLAREGILEPEFCSVEEHLGRIQQGYYDILTRVGGGSWHPENDALPWVKFMLRVHFIQAAVLVWRIDSMSRLWEEFSSELEKLSLPERMVQPLVDAAIGLRVKNASYRHLAGITDNLASRDFKILVAAGFLAPTGSNRGRLYVATQKVQNVYKRTFQPLKMEDPFTAEITNFPGLEPLG